MYYISGTWLLNTELIFPDAPFNDIIEDVNFVVDYYNYESVTYVGYCNSINVHTGGLWYFVYNAIPTPPSEIFEPPAWLGVYDIPGGWREYVDAYSVRKLNFGDEPQQISQTLFDFISLNGKQIEGTGSGFEIALFKNSAEPNRLFKGDYLTSVGSIYGTFRDEVSVTEPLITIQYDKPIDFNYIYIPILKRYYFVNDYTFTSNKIYEVLLSVDVLMSYKDAILNCKGFIERNEFGQNRYLIDNKRPVLEGRHVVCDFVPNDLFTSKEGYYVLNGFNIAGVGAIPGPMEPDGPPAPTT